MDKYEDIINLEHHISKNRKRMSIEDRAAQFAPFAALTGHNEKIKEAGRLTEERIELDEGIKAILDERLRFIRENLDKEIEVEFTYYKPDEKKSGGAYVKCFGKIKKIDIYKGVIIMAKGEKFPINEIIDIRSDFLDRMLKM